MGRRSASVTPLLKDLGPPLTSRKRRFMNAVLVVDRFTFSFRAAKSRSWHRPRPRPRCRRAGCSHRTGFTAEGAQTPVRRPSTFAVLVHAKRPRIERGQPNLNPLEHHDRDASRGPHSRRAQGTRTAALDYGQVTSTRIPPSLDGPSAVRVKPLSTSVNDSPTVRVASAILPGLPKV